MTGLSRCGRQYPDIGEALKAAQARMFKTGRKHETWPCPFGEHWHVIDSSRSPLAPQRPDPFPPAIRALLVKRDECCQRCGNTGRLEAHHRRAKASGGSLARAHTQCACNGVRLCRKCHEWVHTNPRAARAEGWIVLQSVSKPSAVAFMAARRYSEHGFLILPRDQRPGYPTCDGRWND